MHDIWVDMDLIFCWFVFSLPSFDFCSGSFFFSLNILFISFLFFPSLPVFFIWRGSFPLHIERKNAFFFIRVCGYISPSFFDSSYIFLSSLFCLHFFHPFWYRRVPNVDSGSLYPKQFGSLSLFPIFLILPFSSLFCWIYLTFISIPNFFREDCVDGYTYILICIDCKWFRVLVDPPFFCSRVNDNYGKKKIDWMTTDNLYKHIVKCAGGVKEQSAIG